jgi:hypothetical protein
MAGSSRRAGASMQCCTMASPRGNNSTRLFESCMNSQQIRKLWLVCRASYKPGVAERCLMPTILAAQTVDDEQ